MLNAAYAGQTVRTATLRVPDIAAGSKPVAALVYGVPASYIWLPYLDAKPAPPGPVDQPPFELRIRERVRTLLKSLTPEPTQDWLRARETAADPMAADPMDRLPDENIRRYRADLMAMIQALRREGISPVLVTHVDAFGETLSENDRALLRSWRKFYPMLTEEGFLDMERRANDAVRALGAETGVPVIDLEKAVPAVPANFTDFAHFSEAGSAIVAKTLAEGLLPILNTR